jgi:molecular chaperone GrpE
MPNSPESDTQAGAPEREQPQRSDDGDLRAELERIEDRYKRALADLDNYRKRAVREIDVRTVEARIAAVREWLDVVDSVERAIRMQPDGPCREGFCAVLEQINAALTRQGVSRIGAPGEPFDPERHQAIAVAPADAPDGTIVSVERSGFALGDRVIRPAQVVVAQAPNLAR